MIKKTYNIVNDKGYLNANEFVKYFLEKYKYKLLGGKPMVKTVNGREQIGYKEVQQNLIKELENNFNEVTVKMVSSCMFFLVRTGEDKGIMNHLDNINPYGIHLVDGIYDIISKKFHKYTDKEFINIKNVLPYTYKDLMGPDSPKEFTKFLKQVFKGEKDIKNNIDFIQEYMGLLLIPNTMFEKALFIFGTGGNGKGVLLNTIQSVLGEMNYSNAGINELMDKTVTYNLIGKLANIDPDIFSQAYLDKEIIKKIISGERIVSKQLFTQPLPFKPFARMICASNYMPKVKHVDKSVSRRFFFLEFKNSFVGHEDIHLKDKLLKERKQILVRAFKGLKRLIENNKFTISKQMLENEFRFLNSR